MTQRIFLILVVLLSAQANAQTTAELQKEIDTTLWRSFKRAFETSDAKALNATYAEHVIRVTPAGIDTNGAFKAANLQSFAAGKESGVQIDLDFWFDSRHTNDTTSYEVGFFRIASKNKEGSVNYNYGQFHIVLKKINGHWKITQDWDTTTINGKPITAEDFAKQSPMTF
jgi:ketosteroid isomerase-like protein